MRIVWVNPANPKQQYITGTRNDPNVPAGYVLTNTSDGSWQGANGVTDSDEQTFMGGVNSGGYPAYQGDSSAPTGSNGHLGAN